MTRADAPQRVPQRRRSRSARRSVSAALPWLLTVLVIVVLAAPVVYTLVFSFNDYARSNLAWNRPTLAHWQQPCRPDGLCDSLIRSLRIGVVSAAVATVLGTMTALALVRHRLRGRGALEVLLLLPMAAPDVVLGAGLLTLFVQGLSAVGAQLGEGAIVAAHVMLSLSFVVVAVRARLESLDPRLFEASADLYAGAWAAFRHVTLPLIAPGIAGAALLAFTISLDDVVLATFVGGDAMTFPRYVYVTALRGIPAEVNVVGLAMAFAALAATLIARVVGRLRSARVTPAKADPGSAPR